MVNGMLLNENMLINLGFEQTENKFIKKLENYYTVEINKDSDGEFYLAYNEHYIGTAIKTLEKLRLLVKVVFNEDIVDS